MAKMKFNGGIDMLENAVGPTEVPPTGRVLLSSKNEDFNVTRSDGSTGRVLTSDHQEIATTTTLGSVIVGDGLLVDGDGEVSVEQVGHTIEDQTGTQMPQRANLRFEGTGFASVSDDQSNDVTIVRVDNPMTGVGDMIVGGENGVPEAIPPGGIGQILTMGIDSPEWGSPPFSNPMTELGQIIVGSEEGIPVAVDKGVDHQVLGHLIPDPLNPDDPNRLEVGWVDTVMPNPDEEGNAYVTDIEFGESDTGVLVMEQTSRNIMDYSEDTKEIALPLADEDQNGFMAKEDVAAIADHGRRIAALEGKVSRYAVTIPDDATQAQLTALYDDASGETGDPTIDGIMLVDTDKGISYTWFLSDETWHGPESDSVAPFTNTTAGTIKGSATAGKVYAETDGTGSVYGWDALNTTVAGKQNALTFAATSAVSNTSGAVDVKVDGSTITKNATTGILSSVGGGGGMVNPMHNQWDIIFSKDNSGTPASLSLRLLPQKDHFLKSEAVASGDLKIDQDSYTLGGYVNGTGAAYGNNCYLVCGYRNISYGESDYPQVGVIAVSQNNLSDGLLSSGVLDTAFKHAAFLNGRFFVLTENEVWMSTDPRSGAWTRSAVQMTSQPKIVYFKGYYVVTTSGGVAYSTDGENWTAQETGTESPVAIACSNDYIMVMNNLGTGVSEVSYAATITGPWTTFTHTFPGQVLGLAYGNGYWCLSCWDSEFSTAMYSANMTEWVLGDGSVQYHPMEMSGNIFFINGRFVLLGDYNDLAYATNPSTNWTYAKHPLINLRYEGIYGVSYGNGNYVFCGPSDGFAYPSTFYGSNLYASASSYSTLDGFLIVGNINDITVSDYDSLDLGRQYMTCYYVTDSAVGRWIIGDYVNRIYANFFPLGKHMKALCVGNDIGYTDLHPDRYNTNKSLIACGGSTIYRCWEEDDAENYISYKEIPIDSEYVSGLISIAGIGNTFVAISEECTAYTCKDLGVSVDPKFVEQAIPDTVGQPWQQIRAVNGRFFIFSTSPSFITSTDGVYWEQRFFQNIFPSDIAYDEKNGAYVMIGIDLNGNGCHDLYVIDDVLKNNQQDPVSIFHRDDRVFRSISFFNGKVIVTCDGGKIFTGYRPWQNMEFPYYSFTELTSSVNGNLKKAVWLRNITGAVLCEVQPGIEWSQLCKCYFSNVSNELKYGGLPAATSSSPGIVQPDGTSLVINQDGTMSSTTSMAPSDQTAELYFSSGVAHISADGWANLTATSAAAGDKLTVIVKDWKNTKTIFTVTQTAHSANEKIWVLVPVSAGNRLSADINGVPFTGGYGNNFIYPKHQAPLFHPWK
jgi:hypothetical protein